MQDGNSNVNGKNILIDFNTLSCQMSVLERYQVKIIWKIQFLIQDISVFMMILTAVHTHILMHRNQLIITVKTLEIIIKSGTPNRVGTSQ